MIRSLVFSLSAFAAMGHASAQIADPEGLCRTRATALLDALEKNEYATASADFDSKMRETLPPARLGETWESLAPQFGKVTARGQMHVSEAQGYIAVMVPLIFEQGTLAAQIACDDTGAVAGFHVVPLPRKAQF